MLYYTLESLQRQTLTPDLILVHLSADRYLSDVGVTDLPRWLLQSTAKLNWTQNIGPYRKLISAIEICDESDLIVTADDDILFGPSWLERLIQLAESFPDFIISARGRTMMRSFAGGWQNYTRWPLIDACTTGVNILPTNGAGTVFRVSQLDREFLFDKAYLDIAPTTDDLWFRMAALRKGVPVLVDPQIDAESIYLKHPRGLYVHNNERRIQTLGSKLFERTVGAAFDVVGVPRVQNDRAWRRICEYSGLV